MSNSNFIDTLQNKSVLIIGDVMVDEYIWGNVDRISPEAPVPVVAVNNTESRLGGAANVAKNIASLGVKAVLCSVIGDDAAGETLSGILKSRKISADYICTSLTRKTTIKTRILSGNHQILRVDNEHTSNISDDEKTVLLNQIFKAITNENVASIILQDYNKGVLRKDVIQEVIAIANQKKIPVFVDPKKDNFTEYKSVQLFKPNFKEFSEGVQLSCKKDDIPSIYEAACVFIKQQNIDSIMITLSEHGIFIANENEYVHLPTHVREVADVSGAGDTVISTAAVCFMAGLPLYEIARISNIAAGIVCEVPGVVSIQKEQLLKNI